MSRLLYWMTMTHMQRYHAHYHTTGNGHLYQGRYVDLATEASKQGWMTYSCAIMFVVKY